MKPKYLKRTRKTGKEKQRNNSSGNDIERYTQSQSPEPENKAYDCQKSGFFAEINSETKLKPEDEGQTEENFHALIDHQQVAGTKPEENNKHTGASSTHAVSKTVLEKLRIKTAQATDEDKLADNSHKLAVRDPCSNETTSDVEASRHKSLVVNVSKRFEVHEEDKHISEESPDKNRENTYLLQQLKGSEKRQELQQTELPRILSTARQGGLVNDIYRTLVRMKAHDISLTELTDIMKKHSSIRADCISENGILTLLEESEDRFVIVVRADEPLITVKTEIAICPIFTSDPCRQHECNDLHVCKYYLLSTCSRKKCKFGHNLSSKHNRAVFREYTLDEIDKDNKISLIRSVESRNISTMPLICKFYNNEGGCKNGSKCSHLHICKYFINGDCKFGRKCRRCHSILNKQHMSVLKTYGLIPNSNNYTKIIHLLKDTLEDGEVVLKRDIQLKGEDGKGGQQGYRNLKQNKKLKRTRKFSDESETSACNDWDNGDDFTDSELSNLEADFAHAQYDSLSESTDEDCLSQTPYCALGNGLTFKEDDGEGSDIDFERTETTRSNNIKPIMMFESQIENKQFRVRKVNESWQITDESGTWLNLDADETDTLSQLHDDFIRFTEKIKCTS